jgi:hypothetical protein
MFGLTSSKLTLEAMRPYCQWLAFAVGVALVGISLTLTLFGLG